jgi:hypothetical protein
MHTQIHAYMHTAPGYRPIPDIQEAVRDPTYTYIHVYIHIYMHTAPGYRPIPDIQEAVRDPTYTYIHVYIHTYIQLQDIDPFQTYKRQYVK